jgi:protein Mpv17
VWYNLLDQYVMPTDPTSPIAVFSKVALDQVLMAPCMTSLFFAAMAFLEGSSRSEVVDLVKSKLKPTLLANWTVWPVAHVINFALVPPAQRILYINVINIAWTAFMSHMASSSGEESEEFKRAQPAAGSSKQLQQQSSR